jgi:nitroreductase
MPQRTPAHAIDPQFINRWSPRAFTGETLPEETLLGFLEAARWAPSGYNAQPWRFIWGRAGTPAWTPIFDALLPFNQGWAQRASALVLVLSQEQWVAPGKTEAQPNVSHAFDTGAAWGHLALQASLAGWHAHGIGGFDHAKARAGLGVPAGYSPQAVIAIGKRGDKSVLPEALQAREAPNDRLPLSALAAEGRFGFPA